AGTGAGAGVTNHHPSAGSDTDPEGSGVGAGVTNHHPSAGSDTTPVTPGVEPTDPTASTDPHPDPATTPPGLAPALTPPARRPALRSYPDLVEEVRQRIARGEVFQVNVTDRFDGRLDGDPERAYATLIGAQRAAHGALLDLGDGTVVASASPELFLRWEDDEIVCRPMKGTAARRPRPVDDLAARDALRSSAKDRAENVMIVDLLRNDLSRLTAAPRPGDRPGDVEVVSLCDVERYETVWQMTSTLRARVRPDVTLVDVLAALFPCGSVTGAPKIAAMAAIARLEEHPRGVYCGAMGTLAPLGEGPRALLSVPIRTAVLDVAAGTYSYGAGAGITWSSDPGREDAEVEDKTRILTAGPRTFDLLETLRQDADGLHHRDRHLDRMAASAAWFGRPFTRDAAREALDALPPVTAPHRVRLLTDADGRGRVEALPLGVDAPSQVDIGPPPVWSADSRSHVEPGPPGAGPGGATPAARDDDRTPTVRDDVRRRLPAVDGGGQRPVRLALDTAITRSDDPFCCHKTTWREHYDAARARHSDADDVLLVNEYGHVIETTIANLVYRRDGRWWTPPLADGGLAGVGRAVTVERGLAVERPLPADELDRCDALGLVSALRGFRAAVLLGTPPAVLVDAPVRAFSHEHVTATAEPPRGPVDPRRCFRG
ncbi:MAG: bifunctional chorismate-binding protein/class IV aminotransferase, partial [Solirubrobacteraceae bacterium]